MSYSSLLSPAAFAASLTALFLTVHSPLSATEAFLPQPSLIDEPDVAEESAIVSLTCDRVDRAMWYQFYVQKDGALFSATWIRGDDAGLPEEDDPTLLLGKLPVGNYRFWVQAWEPFNGRSEWSEPDDFEVTCTPMQVCFQEYPRDGNLPSSGFWPNRFVFHNEVRNPTATWGELQLGRAVAAEFEDKPEFFSQWVEYDFPGQNGFPYEDIPGLERHHADGLWDWRCREYSPCSGVGPWSDTAWADVGGVECSGPPPAKEIGYDEMHLFHRSSNTEGTGSTPSLNIDFTRAPYVEVYMRNVATREPVYQKWIYFTEDYNLGMPKLPPGDYEIWTRSYHHDCGTGEWAAVNTFTVQPVGEFDVTLQKPRFTANGYSYAYFDLNQRNSDGENWTQPGVDWYQIYVTCGSRVVMNQWVDLEDRTPVLNGVTAMTGNSSRSFGQRVEISVPCSGPVTFWLRPYSNAGVIGEWQSVDLPSNFDGLAPILNELKPSDQSLTWRQPGNYMGQFEVYVTRNGKLYMQDTVEAVVPQPLDENFPFSTSGTEGTLPTSWRPFHVFSEGFYQIWFRNVCGTGKGAWSEPFEIDFSVDI